MTTECLAAAIGGIDEKFIAEAREASPKSRTRIMLYAAACAAALLLAAFGLMRAGVFKGENKLDMTVSIPEDAVLPPAIENRPAASYASYGTAYSVEKAFRKADAVCLLTVKNFITEDFYCSYFEASVDRVYKGELPESIVLAQWLATSQIMLENSPRYTYGDKLLLFLDPSISQTFPGAYDSVGCDISFFYAAPSSDGEIYLFDHKGLFSYYTYSCKDDEHPFNVRNRSSLQLVSDFCNYYSAFDKPIADRLNEYYEACVGHETASFALHVYSLEDMEAYFAMENESIREEILARVPEDAVLPPDRDPGTESARYQRSYTFREAFEEADAVCIVTVKNYLGRDEWSTDFEASVEKTYKGSLPDSITLRQWADSKGSIPFTYSNQLFVYLKKSRDSKRPDAYEIIGGDIGYMYLAEHEEFGSRYLVDVKGLMSLESSERDPGSVPKDYSGNRYIELEMRRYFKNHDPILAETPEFPYICLLEDMEKTMN
ncbi:MAG: hypothetical protein K6G56_04980 [Clostridiales bacterium]|nr:hypothetical protein [Clostridiales bacterium]